MNKLLIGISLSFLLIGCQSDDDAALLQRNPHISEPIIVEGCRVQYINRGYQIDSFYIARCGDTATTTTNRYERQGKQQVFRRSTSITQQISDLEKEKTISVTREKAIAKLTPEELSAIQLK
jgi:uncharacterized protein YcfL